MAKKKQDPIREKFYKSVEFAEKIEGYLFYISALISCALVFLDKAKYVELYNLLQVSFLLVAISLWIASIVIRLRLAPWAQEWRFKDFLASAYNAKIHPDKTKGYYNNKERLPFRRMGAQALENSFYSKSILSKMLLRERWKLGIYLSVWLLLLIYHGNGLDPVVWVSQTIFSEYILSRWCRMEWLKFRFEETFNELYSCFTKGLTDEMFQISSIERIWVYEMAKSNANITLSETTFHKHESEFDAGWQKIRKDLSI